MAMALDFTVKRKGEWVNVLDEYGEKGWIFRKLLWIY